MQNKIFGEVTFDCGWITKDEITLWGKTYPIDVTAEAYYETDEITAEQESAYEDFKQNKADKQSKIETLLLNHYKDNPLENLYDEEYLHEEDCEVDIELFLSDIGGQLHTVLTPKYLNINTDGGYALLFDDKFNPDDGIAVTLAPEEEVMMQDEYL